MAKQNTITYDQIIGQLRVKNIKPIYFLYGEEEYYIDQIVKWFEENLLTEEEKEFNYTLLYGKETDCNQIIMAAKRYPMMSEYQLIVVKEAQNIKDFSNLGVYLKNFLPTSVVVICYKHGTVDRRKKVFGEIEKAGVLYESKRKYDNEIPAWIDRYVKEKGYFIEHKAANLLAEFLGTNLSKIVNEVDKLIILLSNSTEKSITSDLIEKNIGISKEYNNFELVNAVGSGDVVKVMRIVNYFASNPKNNPLITTTTVLFNFFSNLMLYHWMPDKSPAYVSSELKINPYFVKDYQSAARLYSSGRVLNAIEQLRLLDVKSKGFGNGGVSDKDLLRETLFKIMH